MRHLKTIEEPPHDCLHDYGHRRSRSAPIRDPVVSYRAEIESVNQGSLHIITDQTGVDVGDCVAIEASVQHANIRRVSDVYCEAISGIGDDQHLEMKAKESAADCHQAKKSLLSAETIEDVESAKRRVQALCDT